MTSPARCPVLLVDDSEIACESVKHTLGEAALDVVALTGPFGFIKAVRETQPILILIETKAGHGAGKPTAKVIEESADVLAFLTKSLGVSAAR